MNKKLETSLQNICCMCLSIDRKLHQLCRISNGINNLYSLLRLDSEAYRGGFHADTSALHICWECRALLRRLSIFREQVCVAQKLLRVGINNQQSLSKLIIHKEINIDLITIDNFVDCGVTAKVETDNLSEIKIEYSDDNNVIDNVYDNSGMDKNYDNNSIDKYDNDNTDNDNLQIDKIGNYLDVNNMNDDLSGEKEMLEKLSPEMMECMTCCKMFMNKKEYKKHFNEVHKKGPRKRQYVKKPRVKRVNLDEEIYGFKCPECDKCFENKNIRYKHIRKAHREGYECDLCGKKFKFKDALCKHIRLHQGLISRVECTVCRKMIRSDLMKPHMRIHAEREAYSCVECEKRFACRASYEHHLRYSQTHATIDVLKFKCTKCDKGFRSRKELHDHYNYVHLGRTVHNCPVCGKAIATQRGILRHVRRTHEDIKEGARNKICQQCGKVFRDKKCLREHELIHTGERPLSCEICGCTFRQSASLYTHKKRVHKIYPQKKTIEIIKNNK